jgi:hypothetical protein
LNLSVPYSPLTMNEWQHKGSFVIKFRPETDPVAGRLDGRIEHVASGQTVRFRSFEELVGFLQRVLKEVRDEFQQADTMAEELLTPETGELVKR